MSDKMYDALHAELEQSKKQLVILREDVLALSKHIEQLQAFRDKLKKERNIQ